MASEFSKRLAREMPRAEFIGRTALRDYVPAERMVDAELQEVRDVLFEIVREHDDPMSDYGCTTHVTERARALFAQLEIK